MAEPIDFNQRRFDRAANASEVDPIMTLREALRRVESGEWPISSVIILGVVDIDGEDCTQIDSMHGGAATTNERIGIMFRASNTLTGA